MPDRRHRALVAIVLLDILVMGQGVIAAGVLLVGLYHLIRMVHAAARGRSVEVGDRLGRALQHGLVGAGTIGILLLQNQIAATRADRAVRAIERHHARTGVWVEDPGALGVSRAAQPLRLFFGDMQMVRVSGEAPLLLYTTLPPFGRRVYSFGRRSWNYLD